MMCKKKPKTKNLKIIYVISYIRSCFTLTTVIFLSIHFMLLIKKRNNIVFSTHGSNGICYNSIPCSFLLLNNFFCISWKNRIISLRGLIHFKMLQDTRKMCLFRLMVTFFIYNHNYTRIFMVLIRLSKTDEINTFN